MRLQLNDRGGKDILSVLVLGADEGPDAGETHDEQDDAEGCACVAETLACDFAGSDTPLGGEEPDAIGEVPANGDHGDDIDGEHEGIGEFVLDLGEGGAGVLREADAHETLTEDVLADVEDCDEARVALRDIHPVAGPGVIDHVRLAAEPDVDAVESVIQDGQEDEDPLEDADQGQRIEKLDLRSVGDGAFERFEVRQQVLEKKGADGDDAEERMELAPNEGGSLT